MKAPLLLVEAEGFNETARKALNDTFDVQHYTGTLDKLEHSIAKPEVLWIRLGRKFDRALLSQAKNCRVIVCAATGLDHIDLQYCQEHNISVLALKGEVEFLKEVRATAELTLALCLALLRKLPEAIASTRRGEWTRDLFEGREIYRKTVGIIGVGRLGSICAEYFLAMGAKVLGYDIYPTATLEHRASLNTLLCESDIVSIHLPYDSQTRHFFAAEQFAAMKSGAVLINTSRGGVVDDHALLDALRSKKMAGAALDVLDGEPYIDNSHPLIQYSQNHSNLIISPHIGGRTYESFEKTEQFMAEKLLHFWRKQA